MRHLERWRRRSERSIVFCGRLCAAARGSSTTVGRAASERRIVEIHDTGKGDDFNCAIHVCCRSPAQRASSRSNMLKNAGFRLLSIRQRSSANGQLQSDLAAHRRPAGTRDVDLRPGASPWCGCSSPTISTAAKALGQMKRSERTGPGSNPAAITANYHGVIQGH